MTTVALKALKLSIAHWQRLASGNRKRGEKPITKNCALCALFIEQDGDASCEGCPIFESTEERFCNGTPYRIAYRSSDDHGLDSPLFHAAARKELAFLKSLLPKKETK